MKRSKRNLRFHELIGLKVRILNHPDSSLVGVSGIVVDETLNTIMIQGSDGKPKRILKRGALFEFRLPDGKSVRLWGEEILARPEDRAKRIMRGR